MKIALPVNHQQLERAEVVNRFGQALGFLIFDQESGKEFFIKNPAYRQKQLSGVGILLAQILLEEKVKVLLANKIGKKALEYFLANNVEIYKVPGDIRAEEAISQFKQGKLSKLNE